MKLQRLSGSDLRLLRESKSMSVHDLSHVTGISARVIFAAEHDYPGVVESIDMPTLKRWHNACTTSLLKRLSQLLSKFVKSKSKI